MATVAKFLLWYVRFVQKKRLVIVHGDDFSASNGTYPQWVFWVCKHTLIKQKERLSALFCCHQSIIISSFSINHMKYSERRVITSKLNSIAFAAAMRESPYSQFDSGVDGIFEECRSCCFHRPYAANRTCRFRRCPYSPNKDFTTRPTKTHKWILAYKSPPIRPCNRQHNTSYHKGVV